MMCTNFRLKQEQSLPRDGMRSQSKLVSDGQNLYSGLEADDLYLPQIKMVLCSVETLVNLFCKTIYK